VLVGALGDIHGDFEAARRVMARHADAAFWLCVGDVADDDGRYEALPAPLYWIKGNNENFGALAAGALPENLHYLPNAVPREVDGLRVVGLGGTFAPTWYDSPAGELPFPGQPRPRGAGGSTGRAVRDDKRRHFVREEVDACKALRGIDVFLTHEAPRPYWAGAGGRRNDAGKTPVNEVLAAMQPRLHLFGHHHRFTDDTRQGVRSIGLDLVSRSYLLIDRPTLSCELRS
jgi:hypothetical protein